MAHQSYEKPQGYQRQQTPLQLTKQQGTLLEFPEPKKQEIIQILEQPLDPMMIDSPRHKIRECRKYQGGWPEPKREATVNIHTTIAPDAQQQVVLKVHWDHTIRIFEIHLD